MKIKLLSLHLENFRGLREFSINPGGKCGAVIGANGTGKSTLAAAFLWLLTGKDAQGRDNYNIFPLGEDGQRASGCSPSVTAQLDVDGEELVLQRSMSERWTKRRGATEAEYAGDETRFVVNEVPVSAGEYTRRIADLLPEKLLPLLTSVAWFSEQTKDYKERRRLLMEQFGGISPDDVFDNCPDLQPLREAIGSHSVEEYSRICADRRKRYKDALTTIPARIDENRKQLSGAPVDIDQLKDERGKVNVEIAKLRYTIEHTSESEEAQNLSRKLRDVQEQLSLIPKKRRAMTEAVNAEWNAEHARKLSEARAAKCECDAAVRTAKAELSALSKRRYDVSFELEKLREKWSRVNVSTPNVSDVCPACGQPLPAECVQEAIDRFNAGKSEELAELAEKGRSAAAEERRILERIDELTKAIDYSSARSEEMTAAIKRLESEMPPSTSSELLNKLDVQEDNLHKEMQQLEDSLADISKHTVAAQNVQRRELEKLQEQSDALSVQLAEAERNTEREKRIAALEEEKRSTMRALEEAERGISMCQDFTRQMVAMLTQRVNRHFPTVRWKLFEEQKNGGLREVCEATVDGVPYGALNTAAKMQANVEIVAAFGEAAGISMPLFLDNRESVTDLCTPGGMQIINLKVMPGTALGEE